MADDEAPVEQIVLKRRPPEEVRRRMLAAGLPADVVDVFIEQQYVAEPEEP